VHGRLRPLMQLFAKRQRMQLGLSDSNMCQSAEYLKVGSTLLVLDMLEAGLLDDAPRPRRPVHALKTLIEDSELRSAAMMKEGRLMTALEIQRYYYEKAQIYVRDQAATSIEATEVVKLWGQALDALEAGDIPALVGRLDWVTKASLLTEGNHKLSRAALKKIDLRYHELGAGYLARLEKAGMAAVLVDPQQVEKAIFEGPDDTPALIRGNLVRELAQSADKVTIAWGSVRVGGRLRGEVIRLDEVRKRRRP